MGFLDGLKKFGKAMGSVINDVAEASREAEKKRLEFENSIQPEVTLNAEALHNMRSMNSWELEKIFRGKRVHLADDPEVYKELSKFNSWELEAIFGKKEDK